MLSALAAGGLLAAAGWLWLRHCCRQPQQLSLTISHCSAALPQALTPWPLALYRRTSVKAWTVLVAEGWPHTASQGPHVQLKYAGCMGGVNSVEAEIKQGGGQTHTAAIGLVTHLHATAPCLLLHAVSSAAAGGRGGWPAAGFPRCIAAGSPVAAILRGTWQGRDCEADTESFSLSDSRHSAVMK